MKKAIKQSWLIALPFFIFAFIGLWSFKVQHDIHEEHLAAVDKKLDTLFDYYEQWVADATAKKEMADKIESSHIVDDNFAFDDAFRHAYNEWGEDSWFIWRDKEYLIAFAEDDEDVIVLQSYVNGNPDNYWVLNADDLDDQCQSNKHDECGVCDGPGMLVWYADQDNDGLGDPNTSVNSCEMP